jgi:hypothetical protein
MLQQLATAGCMAAESNSLLLTAAYDCAPPAPDCATVASEALQQFICLECLLTRAEHSCIQPMLSSQSVGVEAHRVQCTAVTEWCTVVPEHGHSAATQLHSV